MNTQSSNNRLSRFKTWINNKLIQYGNLINLISTLLAVIGLLLAIYQIKQANEQANEQAKQTNEQAKTIKEQTEKLNEQAKTIKAISESVSTRFVGIFPDNMQYINTLIPTTNNKGELLLVSDFPAYGSFSNPAAFQQYTREIYTLLTDKKARITLIVYDEQERQQWREAQFKIKNDTEYKQFITTEKFIKYFEFWDKIPKPQSKEAFFKILEDENKNFIQQLTRYGATVKTTKQSLPFFLWLSDYEAVISFYNYGKDATENATEVSFKTNDSKLIDILKKSVKDIKTESTL